jgi:predicted PurR-regulated permease PerM
MIPYAGPLVVGTLISIFALVTSGVWHGVAAAIYFVTYGQIEGNILGPLVFRRTVHVNPLVVTLSILFLGELAGVPGAIAAVPIAATGADPAARAPAHPARPAAPRRRAGAAAE